MLPAIWNFYMGIISRGFIFTGLKFRDFFFTIPKNAKLSSNKVYTTSTRYIKKLATCSRNSTAIEPWPAIMWGWSDEGIRYACGPWSAMSFLVAASLAWYRYKSLLQKTPTNKLQIVTLIFITNGEQKHCQYTVDILNKPYMAFNSVPSK